MPNEHALTFHDYLHQGDLLRDEGQLVEAESAYQAALAIDSANINAHYKLFDLYLRMGRESEAMHELERLPEKKWDFSQAVVPESEPEVQYEEAHYGEEERPTAQPLASELDSASSLQERQKDHGEMGQPWEVDRPASPVSGVEIPQNVASIQPPIEEQQDSGHSLFNLPEDDAEEEVEAVDQEFSKESSEDCVCAECDDHNDHNDHGEYDDIAPVLPEDRPQRPWARWLTGCGVLGPLLYLTWHCFFAAPSPAPSSPSSPSSPLSPLSPLHPAPSSPSVPYTQESVRGGIRGPLITGESSMEDSPPEKTLPTSPSNKHIVSFPPGMYQVVRDTRLFEKPSEKSLPLAWLPQGIKVQVVEVVASRWLKIEPRNPNRPSGFLRQFDVTTLKQ